MAQYQQNIIFKKDPKKSKNVYNSTGQRYWLKQQPRYVICLYMPMRINKKFGWKDDAGRLEPILISAAVNFMVSLTHCRNTI